jgi:hypothetical protein
MASIYNPFSGKAFGLSVEYFRLLNRWKFSTSSFLSVHPFQEKGICETFIGLLVEENNRVRSQFNMLRPREISATEISRGKH